jgi:hypothetical protein
MDLVLVEFLNNGRRAATVLHQAGIKLTEALLLLRMRRRGRRANSGVDISFRCDGDFLLTTAKLNFCGFFTPFRHCDFSVEHVNILQTHWYDFEIC